MTGKKRSRVGEFAAYKARKLAKCEARETPPDVPDLPPVQPQPAMAVSAAFLAKPPNFYRNARIDIGRLQGQDLKDYARSIGIMQRDVDHLTEERLRQNCKARVLDAIED